MNATKTTGVSVTSCGHCGREVWGFAPDSGPCLRCHATEGQRHARWISRPTDEMLGKARRNHRES